MLGTPAKKLIIVVDEKTVKYGELLTALISTKDDQADDAGNASVVGIKDGSVETAIWTEKIYQDNLAQLGSGNKVLFIGQSEPAKAVASNIYCKNPYEKYGINYGSLGNKAVIYADKKVLGDNRQLYEEFFENYQKFVSESNLQYINGQQVKMTETAESRVHEKADVATEHVGLALNKGISLLNKGIGKIGNKIQKENENKVEIAIPKISDSFIKNAATAIATAGATVGLEKAKTDNEIMDQQYRCAVLSYYLHQLAQFMEQ